MTDLETACRELVEEWEQIADDAAFAAKNAKECGDEEAEEMHWREVSHYELRAKELEEALEEHTPDAADTEEQE